MKTQISQHLPSRDQERGVVVCSHAAALRLEAARTWLYSRPKEKPLLVLAASKEAASHVLRESAVRHRALLGWRGMTLPRLAAALAQPRFAAEKRVPACRLALEALCTRAVDTLAKEGRLGRYSVIANRPGLPHALLRTLDELRMSAVSNTTPDLDTVACAYMELLEQYRLADRALWFQVATDVAALADYPFLGSALLILDVPVWTELERRFVSALAARSYAVFATAPEGDVRSLGNLKDALRVEPIAIDDGCSSSLRRLQRNLFAEDPRPTRALEDDVESFSAPGESRECVEIARRVLREADRGVPFDRMAIVLRSLAYRPHFEEALGRARVPAYFTAGTCQPDPSGRAFLALLSCAAEGLSARRFAEYLSLAEVPDATADGKPPVAPISGDRWLPPDEEAVPEAVARLDPLAHTEETVPPSDPDVVPVTAGTLRAPHRWEYLLVNAAVIGGIDRWRRRLDGLAASFKLDLETIEDPESSQALAVNRRLEDLGSLRSYALPLLEALDGLRESAVWREWLRRLSDLATRALRYPERVLSLLTELAPMGPVGPVTLQEVHGVLLPRLKDLLIAPLYRPYGCVFVAAPDDIRGLSFEVVFVPGLAEKIFPQKVFEDPILRDELRSRIGAGLDTNVDRATRERLALQLAVGAANSRLVLSHPRLDLEQGRPRVPSFYALEAIRAAEGSLPSFEEFSRRAERMGVGRIGWPAPSNPVDAIDDAEYDLALLDEILRKPVADTRGMGRYLLHANTYLARALRARAQRWGRKWSPADGFVEPSAEAQAALANHFLATRAYAPTALQHFAACPYRFLLYGIHRLAPRNEPEAVDEMNSLQRGALIHDVLSELVRRLLAEALLPLDSERLDRARALLDEVLTSIAARYREDLAPAVERIWNDGVAEVQADLVEWLRRESEGPSRWSPVRLEFAFGVRKGHEGDQERPVKPIRLDCGLLLRGVIDSVEQHASGAIRVTDYKTGKNRLESGMVIAGGQMLQPVLYALAAEKLLPESRIEAGRLYFCTFGGDFAEHIVPLDARARMAAAIVTEVIDGALQQGFLPAAPITDACKWCDYRSVCGAFEEQRTARKRPGALDGLRKLRSQQ